MCDFKPGDEVVCVNATPAPANSFAHQLAPVLEEGRTYVVSCVELEDLHPAFTGGATVLLSGVPLPVGYGVNNRGYGVWRFRKVQRRDLSAWLETAATDTDHLDKPIKTPVRPKVDALLKRVQSGAFG